VRILQSEKVNKLWFLHKTTSFIFKSYTQISVHWIIMSGARCWGAIRNARQSWPTLPSWRLPCYRYEMICHMNSLIRQSSHFKREGLRPWHCCCSWCTCRKLSL